MADKSLRFVLSAVDKSAGKTLGDVAGKGESASKRLSASFSHMGSALSSVLGGEVGDVIDKASEGLDKLGEAGGQRLTKKLAIGGVAAAGLGASLTMMGDAETQASNQLGQAIENTGHSVEEFEKPIEAVVGRMEDFGYTAVNTKGALQILTNSTHDPKRALDLMGEAANLAADKHITLETAASQVAKILSGKGARAMAAYGIQVVQNADGTKNWQATNEKLAQQLSGQASAAADTFTGRIHALTAKVEDNVAAFGQKWGPTIVAAGTVTAGLAPVLHGASSAIGKIGEALGRSGDSAAHAADVHAASAARTAASAESSSATVVASEESAMAAEETSAGSSVDTSATHVTASSAVGSAAQQSAAAVVSAESQAIAAEEAGAQASTGAAAQHAAASAETAGAAEGASSVVVKADTEMVAANEAVAASNVRVAETSKASRVSMLGGVTALAAVAAGAYFGGKALANLADGESAAVKLVDEGTKGLDGLQTALVNNGDAANKTSKDWLDAQLQATGLKDKLAAAGITTEQATKALLGGKDATDALIRSWKASGKPSDDSIVALAMLQSGYHKVKSGAHEAAGAEQHHITALDGEASALGETSGAMKTARDAIDKQTAAAKANTLQMVLESDAAGLLKNGLDALNGKTLNVAEAQDRFKDSTVAINDVMKQNGRTLDDNTMKGRANREAVYSSIEAAQAHAQAVATQTHSTQQATAAYGSDIAMLRKHLLSLGYDKNAVDALIKKYGQMPKVKITEVDIKDNASKALQEDIAYLQRIEGVHNVVVQYGQVQGIQGKGGVFTRFNAGGTDFSPGGGTIVAERETEFIDLPRGSKVTPASKMHGSGTTVNLAVHVNVSGPVAASREMGAQIGRHLEVFLGSGGRVRGLN